MFNGKSIRKLKASEIDVRTQSVKANGLILLLYKDARVDMNILDETFGSENWQREHKEIKGNVYCGISIWCDTKKMWVTKWDAGSESNTEKVKGKASDSFKRSGFNVGIGRELYTSPFVWVNSADCKIENGKCYDKFEVEKITYNADGAIDGLSIINSKTKKRVFVQKPGA